MLKFLTKPVIESDDTGYSYTLELYVESEKIGKDEQKATIHYVNKLRNLLLDINRLLPRFAQAKWYTATPMMSINPTYTVSIIEHTEKFIQEVIKENEENEFGVSIFQVWDGFHSLDLPVYFSYWHAYDAENISGGDKLSLTFYVPYSFKYSKDWKLAFSLEELEQIIVIANRHYDITHANLRDSDFTLRSIPENATEDYYEDYYNVFPHRFECVWMTVLDKKISADQVPQAAKVIPLEKGRTLVMSVADDYFSSYNPEHVLKANLLEIRLHELGLLRPFDAVK